MAVKGMYSGSGRTESAPAKGSKTAEHVAALHRVATEIEGTDYEMHAKTIRSIANQMKGSSTGKAGVKEHRAKGPGQKKTNVALGG